MEFHIFKKINDMLVFFEFMLTDVFDRHSIEKILLNQFCTQ